MSLTDLLRTALRSVSANKLRAALTMLGVVIGVASVIAMLALGNGARAAVDATFQSLGANQIQIGQRFEMQDGEFQPMGKKLTFTDGLDIASTIPLVERVEMSVSKTLKARFGKNSIEINAIGTTFDAIEGIASGGEQADHEFVLNLPDEAITVIGRETQLRQVLINLLENALKFTPQNGLIAVELKQLENECSLLVSDTGIGIPFEDQPRLFERFHRARNASEYAGNGLGLAIVKAIITGHRGRVTVESQPGQGTQVRMSIPAIPEN